MKEDKKDSSEIGMLGIPSRRGPNYTSVLSVNKKEGSERASSPPIH